MRSFWACTSPPDRGDVTAISPAFLFSNYAQYFAVVKFVGLPLRFERPDASGDDARLAADARLNPMTYAFASARAPIFTGFDLTTTLSTAAVLLAFDVAQSPWRFRRCAMRSTAIIRQSWRKVGSCRRVKESVHGQLERSFP
ncbi:MAG: hypothetical protein NZ553_00255 [Caldilinea sp.]|nr:hypothetical protein [Caldilinea sp.]MDW8438879.1 hypothetical protein [Caldilineaceae bacterium]